MTKEQEEKINIIVDKLNDTLKDDEHFEGVWYTWYGGNKVEFAASIKEVPRYKYVTCGISLDKINVDDIVLKLKNDWKNNTKPDVIKGFVDFIAFGEKYGWD